MKRFRTRPGLIVTVTLEGVTGMAKSVKNSIAEPVSLLKKIKIQECGEPLVDFLEACPRIVFDKPRFQYRRETLIRKSVAERLCVAADSLPRGYKIAVLEGWRAPIIQQRMYMFAWNRFKEQHPTWSDAALKRRVNQFSAPMDLRVPPPHTTGAALDVALVDEDGNPCDVISPYEPYDMKSFFLSARGLSSTAAKHRDLLSGAMNGAGITNYPSEYWHYSYGDQGWAYREGQPFAIYSAITPTGWEPDPNDVSDLPLEFVETQDSSSE
jgi:D-alanyl-D-alanine dipeptidase